MPGTIYRCKISYLVKESDANPPEGDTKPPEDSASMKFVYHQLNTLDSKHDVTGKNITSAPLNSETEVTLAFVEKLH